MKKARKVRDRDMKREEEKRKNNGFNKRGKRGNKEEKMERGAERG